MVAVLAAKSATIATIKQPEVLAVVAVFSHLVSTD